MKKFLMRTSIGLSTVLLVAGWALFFSPRPPNTTDPATLAGDGSLINYCEFPILDGSGKMALDIPKGNTPGCSYTHFPLPILAECTEPLVDGADDIRGLWQKVGGGHVERIEQCGRRVVVTSSGIIHDYGPAPSTQPPLTEPAMSPASEIAIFEPSGRASRIAFPVVRIGSSNCRACGS